MKILSESTLMIVLSLFLANCAANSGAVLPAVNADEFLGEFSVTPHVECALKVTVYQENDELKYHLSSSKRDAKGLLTVEVGNDTYLIFNGLKGDYPADTVEAVMQDGVLIIQNTGNAMNQYIRFNECDQKYLRLAKGELLNQ